MMSWKRDFARSVLGRPGSVRLSRALGHSIMGAGAFHGRVRNGIGWVHLRHSHQASAGRVSREFSKLGIKTVCLLSIRNSRTSRSRVDSRNGISNDIDRVISKARLRTLPRFHLPPINVVVYHDSWARPRFEGGFPLRCIQRLSLPHIATLRYGWRHNRYTRGASIPVLSY